MNIKNEIKIGILSAIAVLVILIALIYQYKKTNAGSKSNQ
ncbi:MAG: hypothetical protein KatS3mg090_0405 [Patescibacteria group bacterium]|nr:MAG: hypothetical protein KatS3mg090_0405 [Patescibacteria group bacterium]